MPAVSVLTCYIVVVLNILTDIYLLHIPLHVRNLILLHPLHMTLIADVPDALERANLASQEVFPDHALQWRHLRHHVRHPARPLHPDRRS